MLENGKFGDSISISNAPLFGIKGWFGRRMFTIAAAGVRISVTVCLVIARRAGRLPEGKIVYDRLTRERVNGVLIKSLSVLPFTHHPRTHRYSLGEGVEPIPIGIVVMEGFMGIILGVFAGLSSFFTLCPCS